MTDQQYAFKNRPWELEIINNVDIYDSLGSNIKIHVYGSEIKRILPLKNDLVNEEWISNKTRYFFEGLTKWRINIPLMKKLNTMVYISWIQAFYYFLVKIWFLSINKKIYNLIFLNSMFLDYELIITSKILIKKLGFLSFDKKINININDYYLYYLNPNFYENIKNKKIFIFVGYNLRLESPILNIKLRKKKIKEDIFFIFVGSNFNDNLNCKHLGLNIINLINYLQGKLKISNLIIKKMKKLNIDYNNILDLNIFLLGNNIILREDNKSIINIIKKKFNFINLISLINTNKHNMFITGSFLKNTYIYFKKYIDIKTNLNILNLNLSNILYEELNMFNNTHNIKHINNNDIVYMFGIDNFFVKNSKFCIFQGHHLNLEYLNIDLIFPNVTFLEKSSNYLDIEGNILQTNFILYPPVFSRNDWSILNAVYIYILNFTAKIFNISTVKFLNIKRFYYLFNNFKKGFYFLKKISMNLYYEYLSKYKLYAYNLNDNIINFSINNINKIYNYLLNNKYYNPYNTNIINEYSNILNNCTTQFKMLITNY